MISNDAENLKHHIEEWTRRITKYVDRYKDNMTARNVLEPRTVGADVGIDVVESFADAGVEASIVSKGAVPESIGLNASSVDHNIFQISVGFQVSKKDMALDPSSQARKIDLAMRLIHRKEDDLMLNGSTAHNITGLATAAAANSNGTITAATNAGKWSGETGTDIYDDINEGIDLMDGEFDAAYLIGHKSDLKYLRRMDSERTPYWKAVAELFDKKETDRSWMWKSNHLPTGTVYIVPKDFMAGEFVVSENPSIDSLYNGGLSPGKNYAFELGGWCIPEFHNNDAFVKIVIT
uniref:Major capsid protein n=1 Tax=Candidatus Methanogaster sp. ANME-2c ERB4 TaxID=2759911 RepID=A0A7G9Y233_9EURY|nr:hypothetical protein MPGNBCFJ_00017 [Methanosarcinales archaeon ANME-2c ERB4]QNO42067.1 hypothetical protein NIICAKKE_00017 [Methanosarcinales archaeon ANME-2c ERB4]QNO42286.1 hypothetical protein OEDCDHIP_00003 [Methanosarcinales archaeon ANME-2c ERB4]QNO42441.1 hypothetical protein ADMFNEEM_00007 [Methanosarcinales archaeon ANME-2c ERB4]QNO42687.1 hypothetical protein GKPKHNMI_00009 [Methanosarcinales archaeon ANME-2c ERB4]